MIVQLLIITTSSIINYTQVKILLIKTQELTSSLFAIQKNTQL